MFFVGYSFRILRSICVSRCCFPKRPRAFHLSFCIHHAGLGFFVRQVFRITQGVGLRLYLGIHFSVNRTIDSQL